MRARPCVLLIALVSVSASAAAQTGDRFYRIGFMTVGASSGPIAKASFEGLTGGLAQRGYTVGGNLAIETRYADGKPERLPALAKELVDAKVDVIVTSSYPAARAARDATATIPIVADGVGNPVETGLAASLSHPGGNLTGISDMASELSAKRLEMLKEAVPGLKRVAMLYNASDPGMTSRYRAASAAASVLGLAVQPLGVREPEEFDAAFAAMTKEMPDGILMVTDLLTNLNRKRVFEFAAANRLPAIYEVSYMVHEGGLMSYGGERSETSGRVADLVSRILKGANPADLPFEQPTRFNLALNLKAAAALGVTFPQVLLLRADEVVE